MTGSDKPVCNSDLLPMNMKHVSTLKYSSDIGLARICKSVRVGIRDRFMVSI